MKICLIDAGIFIDKPELLAPLEEKNQVTVFSGIPDSVEEVVQRGSDADVIAFGLMQFTNEMIDRLPNLKVLQFIGTGVWNFVDVDYAQSKGIRVLNIDGYGSNAVAEFGVALGMALARKVTKADRVLKENRWTIDELKGLEIKGSTVGVVGTGSIGSLVAEKYAMMGAKVVACDLYENEHLKEAYQVEYMSMEDVFHRADIVSLHMKVTKENENSIGDELFNAMKDGALLVNVARAELVDRNALVRALSQGTLGGAAIDVYNSEPPSEEDYALAKRDDVIATPHIGYYTQEANDNSIIMTVDSILKAIDAI
jgi:phosphoglycerate dehydrogenase-like enzyme